MSNIIYKIRHIASGKFIRAKLTPEGIDHWEKIDKLNPARIKELLLKGNQQTLLYDTHKGWKTPPTATNKHFNKIGLEIVKYRIDETEIP